MAHDPGAALIRSRLCWLLAGIVGLGLAGVEAAPIVETVPVTGNVYALVGPVGNRTPENLGNNATFGLVVTDEGCVLIDSGGTRPGAEALLVAIRELSDCPVRVVINTGGQDHRWLGNGHFRAQGARIVASAAAVADQRERVVDQLFRLANLVDGPGVERTEPAYADEVFEDIHTFTLGGVVFELRKVGPAHTPGDSYVWLPESRVVFTGDVVYVERMLAVNEVSDSGHWLTAFEAVAALEPAHLVPGHGHPTTLEAARRQTEDYLRFLRRAVGKFMDQGGGIESVGGIDQSDFAHLSNYDLLKGRNAQRVFEELEWE
jgi:glyoxylase-like metal-dependent hydrolase (beta-lactamase superfamily II)